jgi:hypothetical protein
VSNKATAMRQMIEWGMLIGKLSIIVHFLRECYSVYNIVSHTWGSHTSV